MFSKIKFRWRLLQGNKREISGEAGFSEQNQIVNFCKYSIYK